MPSLAKIVLSDIFDVRVVLEDVNKKPEIAHKKVKSSAKKLPVKYQCYNCRGTFLSKPQYHGHVGHCTRRRPRLRFRHIKRLGVNLDAEFKNFDNTLFNGALAGKVRYEWARFHGSDPNKDVAGLAYPATRRDKILIQLNWVVLQNHTLRDTLNTLAHEMIHAFLILRKREDKTVDPHGNNFVKEMKRINRQTKDVFITKHFKPGV